MVSRRRFLAWVCGTAAAMSSRAGPCAAEEMKDRMDTPETKAAGPVTLFLCGDVMSGRGIDQILPHSCAPRIHEPYLQDARDYVALGERLNGRVSRPVSYSYVWGDALAELAAMAPDVRIVNLETAVTTSEDFWPKGINYRMHPGNVELLSVARIDCCALANNHVLDWGRPGLAETLATLRQAGIRSAGAGSDLGGAQAPAVCPIPGKGRVLVFAFGERYSGIATDWLATQTQAGIDLLPDLSRTTVDAIAARVRAVKKPGDIVVASIHWGGNWGYEIPAAHRRFAQGLIDHAAIDVIHGHSSHHFKGIEVYRDRLILYGCGDFLNDYEGIGGNEAYRAELGLMYFPVLDPADGRLLRMALKPTRIRRFQVQRATPEEAAWQAAVLDREGRSLGTRVLPDGSGGWLVEWGQAETAGAKQFR